ncbi:DUF3083 family protein [Neptunicella sp.]|uniref:DUF3083 family protein n=1 Tax=Neptunicella sp. TaxID=2125986 RepID=UPI003F68EFE6
MLKINSRQSLVRKRGAVHKVYVPASARENQYVLVECKLGRQWIEDYIEQPLTTKRYDDFYRKLSHHFFDSCKKHQLINVNFIAKDQLVRVRYGEEQQVIETPQQLIFLYNPASHSGMRSFYDVNFLTDKIELLFLSTGDEVRQDSAHFHQRVSQLVNEWRTEIKMPLSNFKIKDHQHLTWDIYAAEKGDKATKTHGFRKLHDRYQQQSFILPSNRNCLNFAMATLPMTMNLLQQCDIDLAAEDPYNPLYTHVSETFAKFAKQYNLNQIAIIANGKVPIIRHAQEEYFYPQGELLRIGFQPDQLGGSFISQWDSRNMVDSINLVFLASDSDFTSRGYGKFINHLTSALKDMCAELNFCPTRDAITLRFYQHLSYQLAASE